MILKNQKFFKPFFWNFIIDIHYENPKWFLIYLFDLETSVEQKSGKLLY